MHHVIQSHKPKHEPDHCQQRKKNHIQTYAFYSNINQFWFHFKIFIAKINLIEKYAVHHFKFTPIKSIGLNWPFFSVHLLLCNRRITTKEHYWITHSIQINRKQQTAIKRLNCWKGALNNILIHKAVDSEKRNMFLLRSLWFIVIGRDENGLIYKKALQWICRSNHDSFKSFGKLNFNAF